jgi:hypothetical protein
MLLAVVRARSSKRGSIAASILIDAARFRLREGGGEEGVGGSETLPGGACLNESRLEDDGDVLLGDRGYSLLSNMLFERLSFATSAMPKLCSAPSCRET